MADLSDHQRVATVLHRCSYPGLLIVPRLRNTELDLRVEAHSLSCSITGEPTYHYGRWWRLSPWMTDGELAQTALMAVLAFNEHEAREQFKVDGVACFGPHFDLERLVSMASERASLKVRPEVVRGRASANSNAHL